MRIKSVIALAAAFALLGACSTTPEGDQAGAKVEDRKPGASSGTQSGGTSSGGPIARVDVTKPQGGDGGPKQGILAKRQVFFEYDKFEVKDEYRPIVEAHARYLRENPNTKMLIQGNADERGSREYNLGLGQRRSDSVKKMMTLLGARETQVESVSLGEEKPACGDHNEDCWARNRRGDILYSGEY